MSNSEVNDQFHEEQLAAKDATIAAQAAEIERLKEINDVFNETILRNASRYVGIDMVYEACKEHEATIAALRSQLDEQRKRLDGAVSQVERDHKAMSLAYAAFVQGVQQSGAEKATATAHLICAIRDSLKVIQQPLTPHAEKDGGA